MKSRLAPCATLPCPAHHQAASLLASPGRAANSCGPWSSVASTSDPACTPWSQWAGAWWLLLLLLACLPASRLQQSAFCFTCALLALSAPHLTLQAAPGRGQRAGLLGARAWRTRQQQQYAQHLLQDDAGVVCLERLLSEEPTWLFQLCRLLSVDVPLLSTPSLPSACPLPSAL